MIATLGGKNGFFMPYSIPKIPVGSSPFLHGNSSVIMVVDNQQKRTVSLVEFHDLDRTLGDL